MRDLAYRRSVVHSGAADYHHCGHLTTAGTGEGWLCPAGDSPAAEPAWLCCDLGAVSTVEQVELDWTEPAAEFQLLASKDGIAYTAYASASGVPGCQRLTPSGGPVQARFVKLSLLKPQGDCYGLKALRVLGEGGPTPVNSPWRLARAEEVQASGAALSQPGYDDGDWLPAVVPGTALTSFLRAGAAPDPNLGDQQFQLSDSYFTTSYWYTWRFATPMHAGRLWLRFAAVNWKAEIWLNGTLLGQINGAFLRGAFDVTDVLLSGENRLAVFIRGNDHPGPVKVHVRETSGPNGGVLGADNPTIHAAAGWDWIPTIRGRNVGLYGAVSLYETAGRILVQDPMVTVKLSPSHERADCCLRALLVNSGEETVTTRVKGFIPALGQTVESPDVQLQPGEIREVTTAFFIDHPHLWWPNTYGDPYLYNMHLSALAHSEVSDTISFQFGVRELSFTDTWPLTVRCNGVRIVCRGGNWGMDDGNLACTEQDYDIRVRFHKDLHFTMIRNWVGMVNNPAFYEACDRYGILVWDDFWLANPADGPDPTDEAMFLRNAADKLLKNRHHACIALYCGRNEGMPPEGLNEKLAALCREKDGTRVYLPHSAMGLVSGFGPYHAAGPAYYFGHTYHTLHSERGMINIPSLESMQAMLTDAHLWPMDEVWALHDYCIQSAQRSGEYERQMLESFGPWDGLEDFVRTAQLMDYMNHKAMFEAVFAGKSQGMLMWMSNPAWPSMVWQTYDWWYDINGGYQGCKDGCRPVNAIYDILKEEICLVNATPEPRRLTLELSLYDLSGRLLRQESGAWDAAPDSAEYVMEAPRWMSQPQLLRLTVSQPGLPPVINSYWLNGWDKTDYRALRDMPKTRVSAILRPREGGYTALVHNEGSVPALLVELRLRERKTGKRILPVFSDRNFLTLLPGETATVLLDCSSDADARPALRGWNVEAAE